MGCLDLSKNKKKKSRILAIEAHPDDLTYFYGGTAAKLVMDGHDFRVITVTKGSQSTCDPQFSEEKITEKLMEEHKNALEIIGIDDNVQLSGFTNHFMYDSETKLKLRETIIKQIREYKPDTIICFDPSNVFEENPDHSLLSKVTIEASSFAAYPLVHKEHIEEGLEPYFVSRILMTPTSHPNMFVNIAEEPLEKKKLAGAAYQTQLDLMITEIKQRLRNAGLDPDLDDIDREDLWFNVCESDAKSCARESRKYYQNHPKLAPRVPLEYAESFRMCFLGAVEKIKSYLPKECFEL
ncbi:MAG: hypothetical protein GF364_17695 [Candidatus Lokiarchaeota archaeon]|nr:hypothetical protein [Candidatus Lokiarchaeota archaeon]